MLIRENRVLVFLMAPFLIIAQDILVTKERN
jgi:hypothetical protein